MQNIINAFQDHVIYDVVKSETQSNIASSEFKKLFQHQSKTVSIKLPQNVNPLSWLTDSLPESDSIIGAILITDDFPEDDSIVYEEAGILNGLVESKDRGILIVMNAQDLFIYPRACSTIQEYLDKGLRTVFIHEEQTMH
jgi:hypothetical protein